MTPLANIDQRDALALQLASFVPSGVRRRFTERAAEPMAEPAVAVALIADVCGFTSLAEQLAAEGPQGAEQLTSMLNRTFGAIVEQVHAHGGEIVRFAGDAAICVWLLSPEGELDEALTAAVRCAQAILAELTDGSATACALPGLDEGCEALRLRVGIAHGEVVEMVVGGVDGRWEYLLCGDPITRAGVAQAHATGGELLIAAESAARLEARLESAEAAGGFHSVLKLRGDSAFALPSEASLGPHAALQLSAFIPRSVQAWLQAGQGEWLAELRRTSVLFAHLEGVPDPLTELARFQRLTCALQGAIYRDGGSLNQFVVDDKGFVLIGAWGVPTKVYEDQAARALRAALALHTVCRDSGVTASIGVTSGRVFCGARGNAERREYALIGDVVNSSARLMSSAAGGVVCDGETRALAAATFEFTPLPPIQAKNRSKPIRAFRPELLEAGQRGEESTTVGRVRERALLTSLLQRQVSEGKGGLIWLEGEAGIGKSRLVGFTTDRALSLGLEVAIGFGSPEEQAQELSLWREPLEQLLGLGGIRSARLRADHLAELCGQRSEWVELIPLLGSVLDLELPLTPRIRALSPEARAEASRDLIITLLRAVTEQRRLLLVVEDAYWMDSASWHLLIGIHRALPQLLLLVATRPPEHNVIPDVREARRVADPLIKLERLDDDDAVALAAARLGVADLPGSVARVIVEKSEGHPLFTEQIALALRDRGAIRIRDGRCVVGPGRELVGADIPDTVQDLIASRIDQRPPEEQLTLKIASVVGRSIVLAVLVAVHPLIDDSQALASQLQVLEGVGLMARDEVTGFRFQHAITQDVAYSLLVPSKRGELHRQVAETLEQLYPDELSSMYSLLARHWERAEVFDKTVNYLELAAEQARERGGYLDAADFYSRLLNQVKRAEGGALTQLKIAEWERGLATALYATGDLEGCSRHGFSAMKRLGIALPRTRRQWSLSLTRNALGQLRRLLLPRAWQRAPRALWPERAEAALTAALLAERYYFSADLLGMPTMSLIAVNLAEDSGRQVAVSKAYAMLGIVLGVGGAYALAQRYFRRAREVAKQRSDLLGATFAAYAECLVQTAKPVAWKRGLARLEQADQLQEQSGDPQDFEMITTNRLMIYSATGRFRDAVRLCDRLRESAIARSNIQHESWADWLAAQALLPLGELDEALDLVNRALAVLESHDEKASEANCLGLLAQIQARRGESAAARQAADGAINLVVAGVAPNWMIRNAYAGPMEIYLALWEEALTAYPERASELEQQVERILRLYRSFAQMFQANLSDYLRYRGQRDWIAGQSEAARRHWQRAVVTAQRYQMPYSEALAHLALAEAELDEAELHQQRGAELLQQLGCPLSTLSGEA